MLAPVTVLHMPDPRSLAADRLGAEEAEALIDAASAMPLEEVVEEVLAVDAESLSIAASVAANSSV
jgi:hypothetical protein